MVNVSNENLKSSEILLLYFVSWFVDVTSRTRRKPAEAQLPRAGQSEQSGLTGKKALKRPEL